jgi:hypothetical protein
MSVQPVLQVSNSLTIGMWAAALKEVESAERSSVYSSESPRSQFRVGVGLRHLAERVNHLVG